MPEIFKSIEDAKGVAATLFEIDPKKTHFVPIKDIKFISISTTIVLEGMGKSIKLKKEIKERNNAIETQLAFKFMGHNGIEIVIVIEHVGKKPWHQDYICWVIDKEGEATAIDRNK